MNDNEQMCMTNACQLVRHVDLRAAPEYQRGRVLHRGGAGHQHAQQEDALQPGGRLCSIVWAVQLWLPDWLEGLVWRPNHTLFRSGSYEKSIFGFFGFHRACFS